MFLVNLQLYPKITFQTSAVVEQIAKTANFSSLTLILKDKGIDNFAMVDGHTPVVAKKQDKAACIEKRAGWISDIFEVEYTCHGCHFDI